MRTPIARTVLLALAVAVTACNSDGADNPLAPSAPNLARNALKSADTKAKHIHGSMQTTESGVIVPGNPITQRHLEGTGNASHLGRFTVVGDINSDAMNDPNASSLG